MHGLRPYARPLQRADCVAGPRPCPWIGCRWHMCWEQREIKRMILSDTHPRLAAAMIMDMDQTCVLDVCDEPNSERSLGRALGVTHQAVAQALKRALDNLRWSEDRRTLKELK